MELFWYLLISPVWVWLGALIWLKVKVEPTDEPPQDEQLALLKALKVRVLRCSPAVRLEDRQRVLLEHCAKEGLVSIVKETDELGDETVYYVLTGEGRLWVTKRA